MSDALRPDGQSIGVLGKGRLPVVCRLAKADEDIDALLRQVEEATRASRNDPGCVVVIHGPSLDMSDFGRLVDGGAIVILDPEVDGARPSSDEELVEAVRHWFPAAASAGSPPSVDRVPVSQGAPMAADIQSGPDPEEELDWPGDNDPEVYEEFYQRCVAAAQNRGLGK